MTDRELLELAAKAAGYDVRWHEIWQCFVHKYPHNIDAKLTAAGQRYVWVPLDDDGDALRLAVKLNMAVNCIHNQRLAAEPIIKAVSVWEPRHDDPYAATRRAVVRAAAEIGRTK